MNTLTSTRRRWLGAAAIFFLSSGAALAAPPVVEIVAYAHPPVHSALKPLREWLAQQGNKVKVLETDMETAAGERRLKDAGVSGHVPIVVLIDGKHRHQRADGSPVEFVGFPSGPGAPAGTKGTWSAKDVEAVLAARHP